MSARLSCSPNYPRAVAENVIKPLIFMYHEAMSLGEGEVIIYFSVRGRAAELGIIFRIPAPGQGIIFVKIGCMTGSMFVIFDSEGPFRPFELCKCDSNRLEGKITTFFDRFRTKFLAVHKFV